MSSQSNALLWVNKTPNSAHLSQCTGEERLLILSQAQRISRLKRLPRTRGKRTPRQSGDEFRSNAQKGLRGQPAASFDARLLSLAGQMRMQSPTTTSIPARPVSWSPKESRAMNYYLRVAVGNILTIDKERSFWAETVPCLAEQYPAIRHLVTAVSSTHELLSVADSENIETYALAQCNKAIGLLLASSKDDDPVLLVASCILFSAYHLLRCNIPQVLSNMAVGLKIAKSRPEIDYGSDSRSRLLKCEEILQHHSRSFGFNLWVSDIMFMYERMSKATKRLVIETDCIRGPFIDPQGAIAQYRKLAGEVVSKLMRNVARGAYLDPSGVLVRDVMRQFSLFMVYWQDLYDRLALDNELERLELKQIRFISNATRMVFLTRITTLTGTDDHAELDMSNEILDSLDEIFLARQQGRPLAYIELISGILFSLGVSSNDADFCRRVATVLRKEGSHDGRCVNWIRGTVVDMIGRIQGELSLSTSQTHPLALQSWLSLVDLRCREQPRRFRIAYRQQNDPHIHSAEFMVDWKTSLDRDVSAEEIDKCLQGITTAYFMHCRPHDSQAPQGFLREIEYQGKVVPVRWRSDLRFR